jgi:hypothetical protein
MCEKAEKYPLRHESQYKNMKQNLPVVAALKLDDLLALSVSTDKPEHTHASLGTTVGEAHHLNAASIKNFSEPAYA